MDFIYNINFYLFYSFLLKKNKILCNFKEWRLERSKEVFKRNSAGDSISIKTD